MVGKTGRSPVEAGYTQVRMGIVGSGVGTRGAGGPCGMPPKPSELPMLFDPGGCYKPRGPSAGRGRAPDWVTVGTSILGVGNQVATRRFQLVLLKPSHYHDDGYVIRWW